MDETRGYSYRHPTPRVSPGPRRSGRGSGSGRQGWTGRADCHPWSTATGNAHPTKGGGTGGGGACVANSLRPADRGGQLPSALAHSLTAVRETTAATKQSACMPRTHGHRHTGHCKRRSERTRERKGRQGMLPNKETAATCTRTAQPTATAGEGGSGDCKAGWQEKRGGERPLRHGCGY